MEQDYGPIQVVLNVRNFQGERIRQPGSKAKEFFDGNNAGFVKHREKVQQELTLVQQSLVASRAGPVGFVRVRMKEDALAKSHRPVRSLFPASAAPTVGSGDLGELIVQVTPSALERAFSVAGDAEEVLQYKPHKTKPGVEEPNPSRARSEVGAIESVSLWAAADRRGFNIDDAVEWFKGRAVPRAYRVDLFDVQRPSMARAESEFNQAGDIIGKLRQEIDEELGCGYVATVMRPDARSMRRMYVWLFDKPSIRHFVRINELHDVLEALPEATLAIEAHRQLLAVLETHPAVRRISLPVHLKQNSAGPVAGRSDGVAHEFRQPVPGADYPVVGVIDGGIDRVPASWVVHRRNAIRSAHADVSHGTEIAALLVDGQALNGPTICPEPDGCWLADLALIPAANRFNKYYRSEFELVQQIEVDVQEAKKAVNARVFNFSHNFEEPPGGSPAYTELSNGLDRIARDNDVIFVLSAGNAGPGRREWTSNQVAVLSNLAASTSDRITAPADSVLNVAVGAVNPPDVPGTVAGAPARYSRRGPGFMQLVKPDVAHYGGVCESTNPQTGLKSVDVAGAVAPVYGTSFSAPLVAKALARYDLVSKGVLPREALIGLLIHGAQVPGCLSSFNKSEIVRNLVGFGVPADAEGMVNGSAHAATLVFYDRMMPAKDLFFGFDWPQSLVENGKCRGQATLTLVYAPPISDAHDTELVRVNLDACLQRMNPTKGKYEKQCEDTFSDRGSLAGAREKDLMEDGLKWGVVKQTHFFSMRGSGKSSDWRIALKYLLRSDEIFPDEGVPFALVLTIADPKKAAPVYQDMRIGLSSRNVLTGDIRQPSGRLRARGG